MRQSEKMGSSAIRPIVCISKGYLRLDFFLFRPGGRDGEARGLIYVYGPIPGGCHVLLVIIEMGWAHYDKSHTAY
jgi:hypothetical protein